MPQFEFCLPTMGKAVPAAPEWFHEIKFDGYRLRLERRDLVACVFSGDDQFVEFQLKREAAPQVGPDQRRAGLLAF